MIERRESRRSSLASSIVRRESHLSGSGASSGRTPISESGDETESSWSADSELSEALDAMADVRDLLSRKTALSALLH